METKERLHSGDHLRYLDSARGIAALMVLAYHFTGWRFREAWEAKLANIFLNGSDAVSFFFVLSGFVLSYKAVVHGQALSMPRFYVARVFRLVPAFLLMVCVLAVYHMRYELSWTRFADEFLRNKYELWQELFLLRDKTRLYVPGWTLQIELAISFFFPFVILLASYSRKALPWLLLCFLLEGHSLVNHFHLHFVLGVVLSCYYRELRSAEFKQHWLYRFRYPLLLLAALLFSLRHIETITPFLGDTYHQLAGYLQLDYFMYSGISSFVIIAWLISSDRMQRLLTNRVLLFAGKISYGIYLTHWLVVDYVRAHIDVWVPHLPGFRIGFILLGLLALVLTLILATLMFYLVEQPFIRIGKRLAARIKEGLVVRYQQS